MMLLEEDVQRIKRLGYLEDFFVTDSEGFKVLANSKFGRCVFHDGAKCTIYENRPKGCRLYPIILDTDSMLPVRDRDCPFRNEFQIKARNSKDLIHVYDDLTNERSERKNTTHSQASEKLLPTGQTKLLDH
jgi:uncharacterized protein